VKLRSRLPSSLSSRRDGQDEGEGPWRSDGRAGGHASRDSRSVRASRARRRPDIWYPHRPEVFGRSAGGQPGLRNDPPVPERVAAEVREVMMLGCRWRRDRRRQHLPGCRREHVRDGSRHRRLWYAHIINAPALRDGLEGRVRGCSPPSNARRAEPYPPSDPPSREGSRRDLRAAPATCSSRPIPRGTPRAVEIGADAIMRLMRWRDLLRGSQLTRRRRACRAPTARSEPWLQVGRRLSAAWTTSSHRGLRPHAPAISSASCGASRWIVVSVEEADGMRTLGRTSRPG
jgi:hypothetical protein